MLTLVFDTPHQQPDRESVKAISSPKARRIGHHCTGKRRAGRCCKNAAVEAESHLVEILPLGLLGARG